jgi:N utilization substance protein B
MTKVNPRARHAARRLALQALYQRQLTQDDINTLQTQYLTEEACARIDIDYFKQLLEHIMEHQESIDNYIQQYSSRPLADVGPIELSALRIGIYELIYCLDVPYRVVINEAIELSKKFGAVESHKYVNGILDKVALTSREIEINSR